MDLVTEYYMRNNVQAPLIHYASNGSAILRHTDTCKLDSKWEVMVISFSNKDGAPGTFHLTNMTPIHKSTSSPNNFMSVVSDQYVIWDEYEDYINSIMYVYKRNGIKAVTDRQELVLACWEMLLLSCDIALSGLSGPFLDIIYNSMDYKLSNLERFEQVMLFLTCAGSNTDPSMIALLKMVTQVWTNIKHYTDTYAFWLANLLNK